MQTDSTSIQVPIPEHIAMQQLPEGLLLTYRWFAPTFVGVALFTIVWFSFLIFWYSLAAGQDAPLWMMLYPALHVLIGVGFAYVALAGIFNTTYILAGKGMLTIRHAPFPWFGSRVLRAAEIAQLYSRERVIRTRNGAMLKYQLNAITSNDKTFELLSNLVTPAQVRFLEQTIEKYLGIKVVPVEGEMPR